jgi:hypothetical protein
MVGSVPLVIFIAVAVAAGFTAHERGLWLSVDMGRRLPGFLLEHINRDREDDDQGGDDACDFPAGHGGDLFRICCCPVGEIAASGKSYRLMSKKTTSKITVFQSKKIDLMKIMINSILSLRKQI